MGSINLIFDFDGTLVDSYVAIVDKFFQATTHFGCNVSKNRLRELCLKYNSEYGMKLLAKENNLDFDELYEYAKNVHEKIELITLYPETKELLSNPKYNCFIFTHRGKSTEKVLKNLEIEKYFVEVVTSLNKFPRKPAPDAINYLIDKYNMDRKHTYYVGDRPLDIDCGFNAGIKTIFIKTNELDIDTKKATYVINSLLETNNIDL